MLTGFVADLVEPNIVVPCRCLFVLTVDRDAKQAATDFKETFQNSIQRKVRAKFFIRKREPLFSKAFSPKRDIPVCEWFRLAVLLSVLRDLIQFCFALFHRCPKQLIKHGFNTFNRPGHFSFQTQRCIVVEA